MVSEAYIVDNIPTVSWLSFPKGLAHVFEDVIHSCIGVVDQDVQSAVLFCLDGFEELFNLVLLSMVN